VRPVSDIEQIEPANESSRDNGFIFGARSTCINDIQGRAWLSMNDILARHEGIRSQETVDIGKLEFEVHCAI
jgi:hypothetical protein